MGTNGSIVDELIAACFSRDRPGSSPAGNSSSGELDGCGKAGQGLARPGRAKKGSRWDINHRRSTDVLRVQLRGRATDPLHHDNIMANDLLTEGGWTPGTSRSAWKGDDRSPAWTWQTYLYFDGENLATLRRTSACRKASARITLKGNKEFPARSRRPGPRSSPSATGGIPHRRQGRPVPADPGHGEPDLQGAVSMWSRSSASSCS